MFRSGSDRSSTVRYAVYRVALVSPCTAVPNNVPFSVTSVYLVKL